MTCQKTSTGIASCKTETPKFSGRVNSLQLKQALRCKPARSCNFVPSLSATERDSLTFASPVEAWSKKIEEIQTGKSPQECVKKEINICIRKKS